MNLHSPKLILTMIGLAVVLLLFNIASGLAVGQYNCDQINHLKAYNLESIKRAEKSLPTIAYYREHPVELQRQMRLLKDAEGHFQPTHCAGILNPFPKG